VSAEFLESEVLRPFSKADPFMPGSGLGLGLAQRMIEILSGKLAVTSNLGKGTLIHIEVPLRMLNSDNDSDHEEHQERSDGTELAEIPRSEVRQDGIYLVGFDGGHQGVRRLGRSLLRQLKLHFCRVVDDVQFASLIVLPEGSLRDEELAQLVANARPGLEIMYLASPYFQPSLPTTIFTPSSTEAIAADYLQRIPSCRLQRPLRPSVLRRIMLPPPVPPIAHEHYISPIVGGDGAKWNDRRGSLARTDEGEELMPSPPGSPFISPVSSPEQRQAVMSSDWTSSEESPKRLKLVPTELETTVQNPTPRPLLADGNDGIAIERPELTTAASDPLTAVNNDVGDEARPGLKECLSEQFVERDDSYRLRGALPCSVCPGRGSLMKSQCSLWRTTLSIARS
jgi:hypothetical protein